MKAQTLFALLAGIGLIVSAGLIPSTAVANVSYLDQFEMVYNPELDYEEYRVLMRIEHGGSYAVAFNIPLRLNVLPMPNNAIFQLSGDLYKVVNAGERQFVGLVNGSNLITLTQEGEYELDVYEWPPPILIRNPFERLLALIFGETAHAQFFGEPTYLETMRFTIVDANAPAVEECCSSVLFLPGLQASRLYAPDPWGDVRIWEPGPGDEAPSLKLRSGGIGEAELYTREGDVIDEAYGMVNIYKSFLDTLQDLRASESIADYRAVAYDWRLDYDELLAGGAQTGSQIRWRGPQSSTSTPYIIQTLRSLAEASQTKKVIIVAHSNGGLLAKALTNALGAEAGVLIDKMIFVGVPQVGTPKAIAGLLHGADQGLPLDSLPLLFSAADGRAVGQTMPSVFNLLPSSRYFDSTGKAVITFSTTTLADWSKKYGDIKTWAGFKKFMTDTRREVPLYSDLETPDVVSLAMINRAHTVHGVLDSWQPPEGVNFYAIAGWGIPTLSQIEYKKIPYCLMLISARCVAYGTKISFGPKHTIDGDGTVVEPSALWGGGQEYWVNLAKYNNEHRLESGIFGRAHKDILEVPQLLSLIDQLVMESGELMPTYISTAKPPYAGDLERLEFTTYSPVTLGFKDEDGNYSGLIQDGSVVGNIAGVHYEQYGDVQWLSVPRSLRGQLVLRGTDTGSFTLVVEQTDGTETQSVAVFGGVPTNTNTTVTLPLTPDTVATELLIDSDSDGTSEGEAAPESNEPVTISIIKEHIELARTLGWITSDSYKTQLLKRLDPLPTVSNIRSGNTKLNIRGNAQPPPAFQRSAELARVRVFLSEIERGRTSGKLTEQAYQMLLSDGENFINK